MIDQYEIVEKLSALQEKILEKYTPEEVEKLHKSLQEFETSWFEFALKSFDRDFPLQKVLSKEGFSNDKERNELFFQYIVLSMTLSTFDAAKNFFPTLSGYEMLQVSGGFLKNAVWENVWPFQDLLDYPCSKSAKKAARKGRAFLKQLRMSMPKE